VQLIKILPPFIKNPGLPGVLTGSAPVGDAMVPEPERRQLENHYVFPAELQAHQRVLPGSEAQASGSLYEAFCSCVVGVNADTHAFSIS
jgi:hypothetical protein